jgi:hypothetical protein
MINFYSEKQSKLKGMKILIMIILPCLDISALIKHERYQHRVDYLYNKVLGNIYTSILWCVGYERNVDYYV